MMTMCYANLYGSFSKRLAAAEHSLLILPLVASLSVCALACESVRACEKERNTERKQCGVLSTVSV